MKYLKLPDHSIYPNNIKFGIIKEKPVVELTPSNENRFGTSKNSKELTLELYEDSLSPGDLAFVFEEGQVRILDSFYRGSNYNSVLAYKNYKKFKKSLQKFLEGKSMENIEKLPGNCDTGISLREKRSSNCFFCGEKSNEDYTHLRVKNKTLVKKDERSFESRGISQVLSFHHECMREFTEINIEESSVMKELVTKKI